MNIALDARWIIEEPSGIGQYTINLIRYLAQRPKDENRYFLFFSSKKISETINQELHLETKKNFQTVFIPYSVFSPLGQILLPLKLKRLKINLFHSPNFMIPLLAFKVKLVITVHDLIPFLFPEYAPRSKKSRYHFFYRLLMRFIVKRVDHVFTDSENSYQDMIKNFENAKWKTSVLTLGPDPSFHSWKVSKTGQTLRKKLNIEGRILLYVGRQDPYKNLVELVKIFHALTKRFSDISLVIAGPLDTRYPELGEIISKLGLESKVILTGFLSQDELISLYHEAAMLLLPSLYEGFGLPILEAFCCGVPVIASNTASIPELVGDAGLLVCPRDREAWIQSISHLLQDEILRQKFIQRGYKRQPLFTWENTIENLLKQYEKVLIIR